jgi:hypothetical protein
MMTDIVTRLRRRLSPVELFERDTWELFDEAADEIERLRFALERIAAGGDPNFEQDPEFDYGTNVAMYLQQIAREALKDG